MTIPARHIAWMLVCLVVLGTRSATAQDRAYTAPGFQKNHDYFSQLPFESIDLGTGSLVLTFTDLVIPGNAGREWRFQRTYNNKNRSWTHGLGGMVMSVQDTWPPPPVLPGEFRIRPTLNGADGSRHDTNILTSNQSCPVLADCQWVVTNRFWWYDRDARKLYLPDGLINSYDTQGRLIDSTDPFGNSVSIAYSAASGGTAVVMIDLGNNQEQVVTLGIVANSQFPTGANSYTPETMTFRGREWLYTYANGDLVSARQPLVESPNVYARGWSYAYVNPQGLINEITVTTPHGGQVKYVSEFKSYPPVVNGVPLTDTNNVIERTITGPSIPAGSTWTFHYDLSRPAWSTGSARRVDAPSGVQTWYEFAFGLGTGYTRRDVELSGAVLQSEVRSFENRTTIGYRPADAALAESYVLKRADITRESRTYRTDYDYDAANYSNYHRPSQIIEKGNLQPDGTGETNRTTTLGYDYNFNQTPNTNGQRYFMGKVGVETVSLQAETLTRAWGYNHTTGFLNELVEYNIHTGFEPDALGNVAKIKPGQIVPKQTTFTYDWGVLKNTVTPEFTITRSINAEGAVASETRGGRTTTFDYDNAFRPTQTQPPGTANPITTIYNNLDGSTIITQRGSSTLTTTLDGLGRPIATVDSEGVKTRAAYDADERLSYNSYPYTSTDVGTTITYDGLGRVKRRINPDDTYVEYTYGAGTSATRAANGRVTTETWQAFGHPDERRTVTLNDPANQNWTYTYNAHGDLTSLTAPDSTVRSWTYNSSQRLTSVTNPESGQVVYSEFDSAGVAWRKTDARGTIFNITYDDNYRITEVAAGSRVTTTTYEPGTDNRASMAVGTLSTTFTYDASGRLEKRIDTIGGRTYQRIFGYDTNDRLKTLTYPSGREVTYEYDAADRIIKVRDATAGRDIATTFEYHPSGAPKSFTSGNGIVNAVVHDPERYWPRTLSAGPLSLTYDDHDGVGNIGRINDSRAGMNQTFGYDNIDRLTTASGSYGNLTYAYNAHGNRTTAGGVTYIYDPQPTLRLLSQNSTTFGYDGAGNTTTAGNSSFTYTPDHQMETATVGGVTTAYTYDGDGWRATKTRSGQVSDYLRGPDGQLLSEVQNPGTSLVVTRDYIYAGTQLLAVTGGTTSSVTFTDPTLSAGVTGVKAIHITELRSAIDTYRTAAGLSAATWTDATLGGATIKAVHIQELRARLDEARAALGYAPASYTDPTLTAGTTPIRAVHLSELRTLLQQPGTNGALRYYHSDAIGSVRMTTDHSGNVVGRFDYQPFGEPLAASSEPRRFAGAERDSDTGFDYMGARYLSPGIGRFTRSDDLGFSNPADPQSLNLFSYAYNNPLRYVDPTGNQGDCIGSYDRATGTCLRADLAGFSEPPWGAWLGFVDSAAQQAVDAIQRGFSFTKQWVRARADACVVDAYSAGCEELLNTGVSILTAAAPVGVLRFRGFATGQLERHFAKHAGEWGAGNITKAAYLKRAQSLLSRSPGGDILGAVRPNGDILRYNTRTNEFAVGTADGLIRTLFRPTSEGLQYWLRQVR